MTPLATLTLAKRKRKSKPTSVLCLVKACRCRGKSRGVYPKIQGIVVPVGLGMLMGLIPIVKCEKCGKRWRKPTRTELTRKALQ
jgi:hypothetical protein